MCVISRRLVIVMCVFGVLGGTVAFAGNPLARPIKQAAREHLDRGNRLYNTRSFDEAVIEFKAGALVEPAPVFDYNLGQAYRQFSKYQEALWHYQRFLTRGDPKGELLDAVNNFITQMKSELERKAMNQPPAEPGLTPGFDPTKPAALRVRDDNSMIQRREPWYRDRFGLGLAGVGIGGLAVGGSLLIDGASLNRDSNRNPDQQVSDQLHGKASTRKLLGTVIGIGGAGLFVTGIIKLALPHEVPARGATWGLAVSGRGVVAFGTF
jgi:hypothetical protein